MAAQETELERIVVRIVGDNQQLVKTYQQSIGQTKDFGQQVVVAGKQSAQGLMPTEQSVARLGLSAQDARKAFHLLAMSSVIPPEAAAGAMQLSVGYRLVSDTVGRATAGMSLLNKVLIGSGVSVAAAGFAFAAVQLTRMWQEMVKARDAGTASFMDMASGLKSVSQAMTGLRVNVLTEGLRDVANVANATWPMTWFNAATGQNVNNMIQQVVLRLHQAEAAFDALATNPNVAAFQRQLALRTTIQNITDQTAALQAQAAAAGMADRAAQQATITERLAIATANIRPGMTAQQRDAEMIRARAAAVNQLRGRFEEMNIAGRQIDFGRLVLQLQDLTSEANRAGMTEVGGRLTAMVQQFARDNPGTTMEQAFRALRPVLEGTATQLNRISMGNFLRDIRMQGATMGLSSERAKLFEMSLNGVSNANIMAAESEVKHLEALQALKAGLEDISGTRFGSTEALAKIAQYNNQFTLATQGAMIRQRLIEAGSSGLAAPAGSGILAGSTAAGAAGARQAQQQAALNGAGAPLVLANTDAVLGRIEALLTEMRNNARPANNPPPVALQPAGVP